MPHKIPTKTPHANVHFECSLDQHELLSRWAAELPFGEQSHQNVIIIRLFGDKKKEQKELDRLRKLHRKYKLNDNEFLHPQILRAKGIDVVGGGKRKQIGIA